MDQATTMDRYVSFCGIECDSWADELIAHLHQQLEKEVNMHWQQYFMKKFNEQSAMKHNNLFFVGSQMNNLYSFFNDTDDEYALELLWKLEQECC